jgi:hypothetical protein
LAGALERFVDEPAIGLVEPSLRRRQRVVVVLGAGWRCFRSVPAPGTVSGAIDDCSRWGANCSLGASYLTTNAARLTQLLP